MPDIVRRGVTLTEALQEAAAVAPITRVMLFAYELWHPTMTTPVRFVNDIADLTATLESDAPRNAGESVLFLGVEVDFQRPEESDSAGSPTLRLGRPDVAGALKPFIDAARGSLEPWTLIERVYASDDTSAPAMLPPLQLELADFRLSGPAAAMTAQFDDDANVAVPRITFRRSEYPGLQR